MLLGTYSYNPKGTDKFSFILNQISQPYSNFVKNIKAKTDKDFERLQTFFQKSLTGQSSPKKTPSIILKESNFEEGDKSTRVLKPTSSKTERTLQQDSLVTGPCANDGKYVTTSVNIYKCDGEEVTKDDFDSRDGVGCTTETADKELCYCPFDYYGDLCETGNRWVCEVEKISHPTQCAGKDSFNYVYSYSGYPPCYNVSIGDRISMITKLICKSEKPDLDFEGIKPAKYEVIQQPDIGTNLFTYAVEGVKGKLTKLPTNYKQRLTFFNWNQMTNTFTVETTLNARQMGGVDPIQLDFDFINPLPLYALIGRYYYELSVVVDWHDVASGTQINNGGYFEQKGYQEPPPVAKENSTLIIVLIVLGFILLIGLILAYKLYKARQDQKLLDQMEAEPLVADS
jgi:hypothetical protein